MHIFHCACAKWLHFHFRSKIWHHHNNNTIIIHTFLYRHKVVTSYSSTQISWKKRNFGDSFTSNVVIVICPCIWGPLRLKWGIWGQNKGRGGAMFTPNELVYTFGVLRLCQFWWKSVKKCERESARRQTHRQANWFYNLSHAICYSYGMIKTTTTSTVAAETKTATKFK